MENGNNQRLTIGTVRRHLALLSSTIEVKRATDGEYRLAVSDCERTAYYAMDLQDALETGECMALQASGWHVTYICGMCYWTDSDPLNGAVAKDAALLALRASRTGSDAPDNVGFRSA